MKKFLLPIMSIMMLTAVSANAQQQRNATVPSYTATKEDFKPNLVN